VIIVINRDANILSPIFDNNITNIAVNENRYYISTQTVLDEDGDYLHYTLSGEDNESFYINELTGRIDSKDILDYESKNNYNITVNASDRNHTIISKDLNITINDINTSTWGFQTDSTIYIDENSNYDINLSLINENNISEFEYTLSGNDVGYFNINSKGILSFIDIPDYEEKTSYNITVNAKNDNIDKSKIVTIKINNQNELIDIMNNIVYVDKSNYIVKILENGVKYKIKPVNDANDFYIFKQKLILKKQVNIDIKSDYAITLTATDGIHTKEIEYAIYFY